MVATIHEASHIWDMLCVRCVHVPHVVHVCHMYSKWIYFFLKKSLFKINYKK